MSGQASISIKHNFETAHRLPFLEGKCKNVHGHSWKVCIDVVNFGTDEGVDTQGISVDYAQLKLSLRSFIDSRLDHGSMVSVHDKSWFNWLQDNELKFFSFGESKDAKGDFIDRPWPTVEAVAEMIAFYSQVLLDTDFDRQLWVDSVRVHETDVNSALWVPTLRQMRPKWQEEDDR